MKTICGFLVLMLGLGLLGDVEKRLLLLSHLRLARRMRFEVLQL